MFTTELIGLIEIVRSVIARKGELDRAYFENFIQPIWDAFVKVHEDYKKSFREYAQLIGNENQVIQQLIEQIRQDSIYTSDLRDELGKMLRNLPSSTLKTKDAVLKSFTIALINYFDEKRPLSVTSDGATVNLSLDRDWNNFIRYEAIIYLSRIGESSEREKAKGFFDDVVLMLQRNYKEVADKYYELRKTLLT